MCKRGWLKATTPSKSKAKELIETWIQPLGGVSATPMPLCRRSNSFRQNAKTDSYALLAWCFRALQLAEADKLNGAYKSGTITLSTLSELAKLSARDDGPKRARETLSEWGVHLICLQHLPRTYLDGAALRTVADGSPLVALTLRHDRLDNFWFSLLHELAHIGRHFDGKQDTFVDDFSLRDAPARHEDPRESEADEWAEEALIPKALWDDSELEFGASFSSIISFSQKVGVHPAVVAGRIRYKTKDFRAFSPLPPTTASCQLKAR